MDSKTDPFQSEDLVRLQLFLSLIPVFGLIPALWSLSRRDSPRQVRQVSRLAVTLGLLWGLGVLMLQAGVGDPAMGLASSVGMVLQVGNTLWSSGYFVMLLWLMTRVWQRKAVQVPGLSRVAQYLP
ncbi:hypothetical protein [Lyngbya confervoides]|uniref:Uncharacterized protein n=1 Tax=Lyngbya confervoides BDU141951 TaxID=1574623 RepID=A0ABD4T2S2_9CYAN|nr:hypothetical protein [Lyngbya confervoides]MCM1982793.1 hypothetical protein [Lyngbya confervoides BDU141951]